MWSINMGLVLDCVACVTLCSVLGAKNQTVGRRGWTQEASNQLSSKAALSSMFFPCISPKVDGVNI